MLEERGQEDYCGTYEYEDILVQLKEDKTGFNFVYPPLVEETLKKAWK